MTTASAFALRGAVPVFVDIRPDTLNLDERLVESAVTARTKAIVAVHYAGLSCEMPALLEVARRHRLLLVEDAAQAIGSRSHGSPVGQLGQMSTFSFHHTKNLSAGEGGALLLNDPALIERAEVLWQKGTNRHAFLSGQVDKYTWVDLSSSFLPSELVAAFLLAQLGSLASITDARRKLWAAYHELLAPLEAGGLLQRPGVPPGQEHNGHLYYALVNARHRAALLQGMRARGIELSFHYMPLHDSPVGRRVGRTHGELGVTETAAAQLVRLHLWPGLTRQEQVEVVNALAEELGRLGGLSGKASGAPAPSRATGS